MHITRFDVDITNLRKSRELCFPDKKNLSTLNFPIPLFTYAQQKTAIQQNESMAIIFINKHINIDHIIKMVVKYRI